VWTDGPAHLLEMYLRQDLRMYSPYEQERAEAYEAYDYVVLTTRYDLDLRQYPDAKIIHAIERDGAALTVIKRP
jgi:hypothetical protein